jgi:hypothetical protein
MFGYVNINKPELKVKDFLKYKAYYCGLCKTLKTKYGYIGQMTLSYDMTFLVILLTSLYESDTVNKKERCIANPFRKHDLLSNEITGYVADMNIALTYHHLKDDWQDEKSMAGFAGSNVLKRYYKKISKKYPRQCSVICDCLNRLQEYEKNNETDLDAVARCFGNLMSELFVYRQDMWENTLREMGFYLGKFIYILDAYDDILKDVEHSSYNPLITVYQKESFDTDCGNMLTLMMTECSREFEKLPCLVDIVILRNILYEGVWTKFNKILEERLKRKEQKNDCRSIQST